MLDRAHITTLINEGSIISDTRNGIRGGIAIHNSSTIDTIINKGTISGGWIGIAVGNLQSKFGKLIMEDGVVVHGIRGGIIIGHNQTLGDLDIKGKNTKISGDENAIRLSANTKTNKITIAEGAKIEGGENGILLTNGSDITGNVNISGIDSSIQGGSGSGIGNSGGQITGNITISDGANITATSGKAISNSGNASITGGITISGANTKLEGDIVNSDNANINSQVVIEKGASVSGGLTFQEELG